MISQIDYRLFSDSTASGKAVSDGTVSVEAASESRVATRKC
jgi:hypothetical protein